MNARPNKPEYTPEQIDALRERLRLHKQSSGESWQKLAQQIGVPECTLSQWVPGTYNGGKIYEKHDIAAAVDRYFRSIEERDELTAALPVAPGFQMTTSAQRMMTCLALAQLGDITMISTPPGCGKTMVLEQYRETRSNVFLATISKSTGAVMPVLARVLKAMGVPDAKGSPYALTTMIIDKVRGIQAVILIDEAQHLTEQSFEELRAIHDATGCGVVFSGDDKLPPLLKQHAQLHSRIGARHVQKRPEAEDVALVASAWGLNGKAELSEFHAIAQKPGGLRRASKTMVLAARAAAGQPVTVTDIRDAHAQRYAEAS